MSRQQSQPAAPVAVQSMNEKMKLKLTLFQEWALLLLVWLLIESCPNKSLAFVNVPPHFISNPYNHPAFSRRAFDNNNNNNNSRCGCHRSLLTRRNMFDQLSSAITEAVQTTFGGKNRYELSIISNNTSFYCSSTLNELN